MQPLFNASFFLMASMAFSQSADIYGNFIYVLPEGWTTNRNEAFLEVFPASVMQGEAFSVLLLSGKSATSALEDELASSWEEIRSLFNAQNLWQAGGNVYELQPPQQSAKGWTYISASGSIRIQDDYFVHLFVIQVKDRMERVAVLCREVVLDAIRRNYDSYIHHTPYYNAINSFIFSLKFRNWEDPPLPPASWQGKGVTGVWNGIGWMGGGLRTTFLILFDNGQAYYGGHFPISGLYELDTYAEASLQPRYWGTYSPGADRGVITMPFGPISFQKTGDQLEVKAIQETHTFIRCGKADAIRLNGEWSLKDEYDNPVSIRFFPDGSFQDNGALRILDHSVYYYSMADGGGNGQYEIKDYTIVFHYSDGRELRIAFPGIRFDSGNISPSELILSFNEDLLIRK